MHVRDEKCFTVNDNVSEMRNVAQPMTMSARDEKCCTVNANVGET